MQPSELIPITKVPIFETFEDVRDLLAMDLYTAEQMADALESAMDAVLRKPFREELAWRDVIKELRLKE
jgi:hypothetical protein